MRDVKIKRQKVQLQAEREAGCEDVLSSATMVNALGPGPRRGPGWPVGGPVPVRRFPLFEAELPALHGGELYSRAV